MYSIVVKNLLQNFTCIVWFQQIFPINNGSRNTNGIDFGFITSNHQCSDCKVCCSERKYLGYFLRNRLGKFVTYKFLARSLAWFSNRALYVLHKRSISSDADLIFRTLRSSPLRMYHGALTMVLRIMDYNASTLTMWLLAAIPHNSMPYVQIGLMTYL